MNLVEYDAPKDVSLVLLPYVNSSDALTASSCSVICINKIRQVPKVGNPMNLAVMIK